MIIRQDNFPAPLIRRVHHLPNKPVVVRDALGYVKSVLFLPAFKLKILFFPRRPSAMTRGKGKLFRFSTWIV